MTEHPKPNLWALLIAAECYLAPIVPGVPVYPGLRGPANDVALMDAFLRTRLKVPAERIFKLTASGTGSIPVEPRELWPTRTNIVAAFRQLAARAQPGDLVHIHYSGHGGRANTLFPAVKGPDGLDESLVPIDYGQGADPEPPEDRYLRDLELAWLLRELVERRLLVTLVLDSCHSGGATRGTDEGTLPRGGFAPDRVSRTASSLVASPAALQANWQALAPATRSVTSAVGWLPAAQDFVLLAACRALELALEYRAPNGRWHGALSYWLWHTLQHTGLNWEMVRQQVVARVHGSFASQTPQLQGPGGQAVFGGMRLSLPAGVNVLEARGDLLRLGTGQAVGAAVGARYFVYPNGVTDFAQTARRVAQIELVDVQDVYAWARIMQRLDPEAAIEPGAQAVLFDPGRPQQRAVRLVQHDDPALHRLAAAIAARESRFIRLAADGEAASLQVRLDADDSYILLDNQGQPLPNVPLVPAAAPERAAYQLEHLARYFTVLELGNSDALSSLAGKLEVRLLQAPEEPFDDPGGIPTVKAEQPYYLHIRNLFEPLAGPPIDAPAYIEAVRLRTLNITVLDLAPDWSIHRLIPIDSQHQCELGPGETLPLPALRSSVPAGLAEAVDILKVIATTGAASFDALLLPPLTERATRAAPWQPTIEEPQQAWLATQVMVRAIL